MVLVVDDEKGVRNFMRDVLVHEGYVVRDAECSREALEICRSLAGGQIRLLVINHGLPPSGGRVLAEQLLEICPAAKVLVVSGWPLEDIEGQGGIIPGGLFLPKPFTIQQLVAAVRAIISPDPA